MSRRRFSTGDQILATLSNRAHTVTEAARRRLHVLTLTPFYPSDGDEVGGCFVAEALQEAEAQGLLSCVIAVDPIHHPRRKSSLHFRAEWVRYAQIPGNFGLSSAGRFLRPMLLNRVQQLHRQFPISLIHAHAALPCGHAALLLSQSLGIPYVVTIHGLDVYNSCFQSGIGSRWRRERSRRVYAGAAKVICISEKVRQLLINQSGDSTNVDVIYNGTDAELFAPTVAGPVVPNILVVGNLLAGKGHELVLRAFGRIKDLYPDLRCTIVGEGADRDRFVSLAKALGIDSRVDFVGRQSRREVAEAMRNCSVFVLPSRYEALGCVYLEAMACGKPVIACQGQGIDEIIQHRSNGWLIPVDGIRELVEALQILLQNAELRVAMGKAARKTIVDNFTLAHQARKLTKIYEEVAG
jgi:glycosyltransferase involved in cell wall biosynthesis